jgi:DNA-binding NarL/FixJ family response regulator
MHLRKFDFSYEEYNKFIVQCPFTDEELKILEMRRKGKSVIQVSMELNLSDRTVERRIKSIEKKIIKEIKM